MVKVAVVILNWNGRKYLEQFIPSVIKNTDYPDTKIIVADNGSTDDSVRYMQANFPEVELILLDKNYGFAGGYNQALKQIEATYFVLLNSDVEPAPCWLAPLVNTLEADKTIAACQPVIKAFHNRSSYEHAGAAGGFIDYLGYPFCRGRVFAEVEKDNGQYSDTCDIFWASGACMLIRAELFHKAGGFDDAFFAHMEEIDLCWRLNARGYRLVCVPQSTVYHVGGGTLSVESPRKTYLNFRNNLLMLYKNLPQSEVDKVLRKRFYLDYLAIAQLFITGKRANAKAAFQARQDFKRMKSQFLDSRNENLRYATCTQCSVILNKSIVQEYFLHKKKRFSELYS